MLNVELSALPMLNYPILNYILTIGEYFENLKTLADHAGADKTGVKIETNDGYCIDITVTKKQNKK